MATRTDPTVVFGGNRFKFSTSGERSTFIPIQVDGKPLIRFDYENERLLLSLILEDGNGQQLLTLLRNQIVVNTVVWDFDRSGSQLFVRMKEGDVVLHADFEEPSTLVIARAKFRTAGVYVEVYKSYAAILNNRFLINNSTFGGHDTCIAIGEPVPVSGAIIMDVNRKPFDVDAAQSAMRKAAKEQRPAVNFRGLLSGTFTSATLESEGTP